MPFNTALSGIRAANTDLQVTGNNIANASTTGFKSSRAEFGDVYAGSILGSGSNSPGSGVNLQTIRQQFSQGNRNFTSNDLDLAVNGQGFFVLSDAGDRLYTRAGAFGLDNEGFVVSNTGANLQGFSADANGNLGGTLSNLRVDVSTQAPRQTTLTQGSFNLNANEAVLETVGASFETDGAAIGVPQFGLREATTTTMNVGAVTTPINFGTNPTSFDITLSGSSPASGNGTVNVVLDSSTANSMQDIANLINSAIFGAAAPINAQAVVNAGNLEFRDLTTGVSSNIDLSNVTGTNNLSNALSGAPASVAGIRAVDNGYLAQTIEFEGPDGSTSTFTSERGASAAQSASELNALGGITASARTEARIMAGSFDNSNGNLTLNGVTLSATTLDGIANEINNLSTSSLASITAEVNTTGDLEIVSRVGTDLRFGFSGSQPAGNIEVAGRSGTGTQTVNSRNDAAVVGGNISLVMAEGYSVASASPEVGNLFAPLTDASFTPMPINAFDPNDQGTYNHATTSTVFDSLGNAHTLEQYFVRQPYDPSDASTSPNHWVMYVQVDGQNVGDPDPTLPSPQNIEPTMASYNVHFNRDGSLNTVLTDSMLVSNWRPRSEDGTAAGALGPLNVLQGGQIPVQDPPTSSNFEIDLSSTTQFGAQFGVESQSQNGYTTGRLSGLDIAEDGIIFARFTNGEAQVLGQVALANFNNVEGLRPVGNTMWAQTAATGEAVIGGPGTASLGSITAGALEESNVDLSEQLVNLIIAQRNFQASSKTIETANQTTQTIINLR
ncbi:flagellar hook-basal body complex protein [Marinimicrobium sp. ABcell2]|uniref:flagellar hook-basal body complex protein n=1 Tax=Marinimicrobium sp. ABcell2 TaxID=3069751 RepID=UPI0027B2AB56|nr:flagellar hook-basal body complex protein [Marinimicrobium sp. ABcell2]MDQ2077337.1 flagellar hook-basal body complex protein [Marinimicrobium sp. ABcell2]